ncbi:hypothetical protein P3T76_010394 [Phytophthora citrophthora]|uniref:Uncharacterized protein n=1 Tax=Phytophthora citrophthora TaxID=4793 RepID=A0AAD9GC93_9STRA|nr:hypothetical protein P3T76_010394 [Phytophthora citrophthora]
MLTSHSALVLTAVVLATHANAHSNMILPLPTWSVGWSTNSFAATIQGDTYLPIPDGMSYSTDPADNTEAYWTAFNKSTYTTLKDLIDKTGEVQTQSPFGTATLECGFSLANGTARDLPDEVEWNQLTSSHEGPCEVWCDDILVFEDSNCAVDYTSDPAKLPYDKSKCEGASMLTSYWLALHGLPWQAYINCAPLTGSVASGSTAASSVSTTTTATTSQATTTATPSSTTATTTTSTTTTSEESSAADSSASEVGGEAETTDSPVTTTAPTTSSGKCSVRHRRD